MPVLVPAAACRLAYERRRDDDADSDSEWLRHAVTSAIKYGCSHKIDKYWRKDVEKKFADGSAEAVAEVCTPCLQEGMHASIAQLRASHARAAVVTHTVELRLQI